MITPDQIQKMYSCSLLLPDPGSEVVKQCLDEIVRLRQGIEHISIINNIGYLEDSCEELLNG